MESPRPRCSRRPSLAAALATALLLTTASVAAAADGKALYATKCAMCHGAGGTAAEMWAKKGAPNFNDAAWQKSRTDEAITKSVVDGNPAKMMPAYKGKLTDEEIRALVKHVRTLAPAK